MKHRLLKRLFIVLPVAVCLSIITIGNAFAADPVTVRYEVTSYQTGLDFISYQNENGPRTELLKKGTTTWSYQFTTANMGQRLSVYPVPVNNLYAPIALVSKVYINGVLYKTVTGQNTAAASIDDTLGHLLTPKPATQWTIRYEVSTKHTALGLVTYSNNHTLSQSESLAAGRPSWNYQYTTTNVDQPVRIEAESVVPNSLYKFYTVVIKVFVNNDLLYYTTFDPYNRPAVVDVKLRDLLEYRQPLLQPTSLSSLKIIPGIAPHNQVQYMGAVIPPTTPTQAIYVFKPGQVFKALTEVRTASFSVSTNDRYVYMTFVTGPQLEVPAFQGPPGTLLAVVPQP